MANHPLAVSVNTLRLERLSGEDLLLVSLFQPMRRREVERELDRRSIAGPPARQQHRSMTLGRRPGLRRRVA